MKATRREEGEAAGVMRRATLVPGRALALLPQTPTSTCEAAGGWSLYQSHSPEVTCLEVAIDGGLEVGLALYYVDPAGEGRDDE